MNYLFKILFLYYKTSKKEKRFKNKLEYKIIDFIMIKVNNLKILMAKLPINQLYLTERKNNFFNSK